MGKDAASTALSAGDDGGVREAKWEIGVAGRQLTDAGEILLSAIEKIVATHNVTQERIKRSWSTSRLDQVGNLGEDRNWDHEWSLLVGDDPDRLLVT